MSRSETAWDLVYGVPRDGVVPPAPLLVDYDLARLGEASGEVEESRCAELAELEGPYRRILVHLPAFTPRVQYELDFHHAARLLAGDGLLRVEVGDRKAARMVGRELRRFFGDVQRQGSEPAFECRDPRPGEAPPILESYRHTDPHSGVELELHTRPGLFSYRGLDPGTALLLEAAGDVEGLRVLDLGCGYGAVGLMAAARGARATLVDTDARAVSLARRNAGENGFEVGVGLAVEVRLQDGTGDLPAGSFDRVLSNPPTHAGSAVLRRLFAESMEVLVAGGRALFVVREHLNYEKWLRAMGRLSTPLTGDGYKILELTRDGGRNGRG